MGLKVRKKAKKNTGKENDAKSIPKNVRMTYDYRSEKKKFVKYLQRL